MADVTIDADIQLQVDGFLRFADYFFDGIFADWAVQNRIRDSQKRVAETKLQIERVLPKLRQMKAQLNKEFMATKQKLDEVIVRG